MLAPIPRNLAHWIWVHEARRVPQDNNIRQLTEQISGLPQEIRGHLTYLYRASHYPFNKDPERRRYAETLLQLFQDPQHAETSAKIAALLQAWRDFIYYKIEDMEFLKTVKFTMQDARNLLENTAHSLSQEDKAFLSQIAEKCGQSEERIRLQKIFVTNAMQSQAVRSQSLQDAFFAQYAQNIELPEPTAPPPSTGPTISTAITPISIGTILSQSFMSLITVALAPVQVLLRLFQVAVGYPLPKGRNWLMSGWVDAYWHRQIAHISPSPTPALQKGENSRTTASVKEKCTVSD